MIKALFARRLFFSDFLILLVLTLLFLGGCKDPQIDALGDNTAAFSVYGAIDMDKNVNYIRVKDLTIPLASDRSKSIDASVIFKNPNVGTEKVLKDTVVEFSGNFTHNYLLDETLETRKSYQLDVIKSDGKSSTSVFTTPGITVHGATPNENVSCYTPIEITFQNVLPTEQIRYEVGFQYENQIHWLELSRICPLTRIENKNALTIIVSPLDLMGAVFPKPNVNILACRFQLADISCSDLDSDVVQFRYLHLGPEWQKVYPIYPINPENVDDVTNGLGFLGAYRRDRFSITVNTH